MTDRVLYVDDDRALRSACTRLFRGSVVNLDVASGFADAMALVGEETYAAIAVDFQLGPDNGLELIERLRTLQPNATLILVTGHDDPALARRAQRELGVWRAVTKPWTPDGFVQLVRDAVARSTASSVS